MRAFLTGLLLAAISLAAVVAPASAAEIAISPTAGSPTDIFTVSGEGLMPGLALDVNFKSPSGAVFSTATLNKVVVADSTGAFGFDIVPAREFAGQPTGAWIVQVCASGTDDCVQAEFTIS